MTIHVFRYSQLVDTNRMGAVEEFVKYSGLSLPDIGGIASATEKGEGIISLYKLGKIDNQAFRKELNDAIVRKGGKPLEDSVFDNCWNAMCTVNSENLSKLYQFQSEHKDCQIHIIRGY